jgi:hypothetical protein
MNAKEVIANLRWLRTCFRATFKDRNGKLHNDGRKVLAELRRFCFADRATIRRKLDGSVDPYASIAAAGRQEVYMRIISYLDLDDADLAFLERRASIHESEGMSNG